MSTLTAQDLLNTLLATSNAGIDLNKLKVVICYREYDSLLYRYVDSDCEPDEINIFDNVLELR